MHIITRSYDFHILESIFLWNQLMIGNPYWFFNRTYFNKAYVIIIIIIIILRLSRTWNVRLSDIFART
jgi:hypothetical protein